MKYLPVKDRTALYYKPCRILNCPFSQYGPSETDDETPFICLTPLNMTTHEDYLDHDLLSETIPINIKQTLSLTMVERHDDQAGFESFNYIWFEISVDA